MAKLHKKFGRQIGDPGGTVIHKLTTGSWDRGPDNARSGLMPWEGPPEEPPPVAPMPDEEEIKRVKRRSSAAQMRRAGRQSTILTESDRLGP